MKELLQVFMRRLTNLNSHNRSLLLLRLNSGFHLDLHQFDYLLNKPSFTLIEKLIAGSEDILLCKNLDPRDERNNLASRQLKKLKRSDEFIFGERGSRDLYVGWPFVRGKFSNGNSVRCPLVFFPVTLDLFDKGWTLSIRKDVGISFNKSFFLAYYYFNGLSPNEKLIEFSFEEFDRKSRPFRTQLYNLLKDEGMEINFNTEMFEDTLGPFSEFRKKDFEENEKDGMLKLYPEAVIGIFPQAGSLLIPDYNEILENNSFNNIEEFFLSRTTEKKEINPISADYFMHRIKEENIYAPLELDAWQENALRAVKAGHSVVVQGPPGTGKSQLLCNLIADFISRGKTVLAVSQKRAALDVVYARLQNLGIAEFCALVHDFRNDRKEIYDTIADHIERLDEYRSLNGTIDAIQLERNYLKVSRNIDRVSEELEELKKSLFDESECGLSLKELYLTSDMNQPFVDLRQEYRQLTFDKVDDFTAKLKKYTGLTGRLSQPENLWKKRLSFGRYGPSDRVTIRKAIKDLADYVKGLGHETARMFGAGISFEEVENLSSKTETIGEIRSLVSDKDTFDLFMNLLRSSRVTEPEKAVDLFNKLLECFNDEGPETTLDPTELTRFQEALQYLVESRKNPFRWLEWQLFSQEKSFVKRVLSANKLEIRKRDLSVLTRKLDNRLNVEHYLTGLRQLEWMGEFPGKVDYSSYRAFYGKVTAAVKIFHLMNEIRELRILVGLHDRDHPGFLTFLDIVGDLIAGFSERYKKWKEFLAPVQIKNLTSGNQDTDDLLVSLDHEFDYLCAYDRFNETLTDNEKSMIGKLMNALPLYDQEAIVRLFQNSLRLSWIEHLETKFPVVNIISTGRFDDLVNELQSDIKEKKKISGDITRMKLREKTYQDVKYNRLSNRETYRELHHQVSKKRNIWPVRKLLAALSEEIFNLQPCWLTSPESASAIFPMIPLFDLVIFDEASQCFPEKGLPSMYKGKQVVVAGDSKQLSPFDFYQARWVQEDDDNSDLEVDSLLDLASRYLMQVQLQGHYRSRSLDLIEFSNRNFYKGNLRLLPDRHLLNENEPAIRFVKVEGTWENNTNITEAAKVVSLVDEIDRKNHGKSIGIITFNAPQQEMISELMEDHFQDQHEKMPGDMFIKNIENVQGDERDIIIFSLVHGPGESGKISRQFGSLNIVKGENRLNVAVTRAREMIYVVASFWPDDMDTRGLKNEGPVLLKKYLEYALEVSRGKFRPDRLQPEVKNRPWYLRDRISAEINEKLPGNISVNTDMPFADLTIMNRGKYTGLILSDDDLYFQSLSVKDIHAYTPFLYSSKNWKFRAVFSRDYWKNKNETLEQINRFIHQIQSAGDT